MRYAELGRSKRRCKFASEVFLRASVRRHRQVERQERGDQVACEIG